MARLVLGTNINNTGTSSTVVEKPVPMPYSIQRVIDQNGVFSVPTNENIYITTGNATSIGDSALAYAYCYSNTRTYGSFEVDFPEVTEIIKNNACSKMMQSHGWIPQKTGTFSAPKLKTVSGYGVFSYAFYSCKNLVSIDLSSLTTVSGYSAFDNAFRYTAITTLDLHNLKTISGQYGMMYAFADTQSLTSVDISGLETISGQSGCAGLFSLDSGNNKLKSITFDSLYDVSGGAAFSRAFWGRSGLENIYFPALRTISFGSSTNQFNQMLGNVTGCTIHFPSNLEPTIQTLTGYPNFSGTGTILAFDLPATE